MQTVDCLGCDVLDSLGFSLLLIALNLKPRTPLDSTNMLSTFGECFLPNISLLIMLFSPASERFKARKLHFTHLSLCQNRGSSQSRYVLREMYLWRSSSMLSLSAITSLSRTTKITLWVLSWRAWVRTFVYVKKYCLKN